VLAPPAHDPLPPNRPSRLLRPEILAHGTSQSPLGDSLLFLYPTDRHQQQLTSAVVAQEAGGTTWG
jgi:hypothetical protein